MVNPIPSASPMLVGPTVDHIPTGDVRPGEGDRRPKSSPMCEQRALVDFLFRLTVRMRALSVHSCNNACLTDTNRRHTDIEFQALRGEFAHQISQAAQQEQAPDADVFSPPVRVGRGLTSPGRTLAGSSAVGAALGDASVATVRDAQEALNRLDMTLAGLAEIEHAVRAVATVLEERSRYEDALCRADSPALAARPERPDVGSPLAALVRPSTQAPVTA